MRNIKSANIFYRVNYSRICVVMHGEKELLNEPNYNDMFSGSAGGFGTDRLHAGGQQSRRRVKRGAGCCEQCGTKCTAGKHGTARAGND